MTLLLVFLIMLLAVAAMAVGLFFGRRPLQGSCGGLARLGLGECEICGGDPARCDATKDTSSGDDGLSYDAAGQLRKEF